MRILITAPDRDLLDSLRGLLTLRGVEADTAHDGVIAIEKTRAVKYDTVFVDEKTPLIRADDLISELEASGTPAVLMTENEEAIGGAVIKYPFTPEEFFGAIEKTAGAKGEQKNE